MDHRVDPSHRLPQQIRIVEFAQVTHRDLDVHPVRSQAPWIADQAAHVLTRLEQTLEQAGAGRSGRTGEENQG